MASIVRGTSMVLSVSLVALVAACSSGSGSGTTGPTPPTASAETMHLDSLWAASSAAEEDNSAYDEHTQILGLAEYATAYGAAPSFYAMSLDGTKQTWTGVALEVADNGDSELVNILWDDASADNMIVAEHVYQGAEIDTVLIVASDTIDFAATSASVAITRASTGSGTTCTLQSGLQNTGVANLFGGDTPACSSMVMSATVSATSTPPTGAESILSSIAYSNSQESGEYFLDTTDPLHVPSRSLAAHRIRALLQAIHANHGAR
jgi:hypothetical protein